MNRLAILGVLAVAGSCSVHEVKHNPAPPVQVPEGYQGETAGPALPGQWWQDFRDPDLDVLVDAALADNLQLAGAFARIEQARAVANKAGAGRWPQINANLNARRSSRRVFFGPQVFEFSQNQFDASVGAAYEVDVWKRIGSQHASAKLEVLATRDDLEAIAISLTSEVAEAWFDLLAHRERRTLLEAQLATNEIFLELVALRAKEGIGAGAVDVFQASSQVDAVKAQLALIDALGTVAEYRIAVLVGKAPGTVTLADRAELPPLPQLPGTGVPADLLLRRPDVRSIRRRVESADHRVASAVADRLPRLSLSGDVNVTGTVIGDLIARPLYNLGANLLGPLFDGGLRKAEVDRSAAVVDELAAAYGQVLLGAMFEVESALVLENAQLAHISELEHQVETNRATLGETRNRYREGITDFLPVLGALQTLQMSEQNLLSARRQLLSYRIQLCRALGGTWTAQLKGEKS